MADRCPKQYRWIKPGVPVWINSDRGIAHRIAAVAGSSPRCSGVWWAHVRYVNEPGEHTANCDRLSRRDEAVS